MQQVRSDRANKSGTAETQQSDPVPQSKKLPQLPAADLYRQLNNHIHDTE